MRVLIADDHEVVRRGLKAILTDAFPGMLVFEVCNGDEALTYMAETSFDLLLFDIDMHPHRGLSVLRDVKQIYPEVPVIIVSMQQEEQYAQRCIWVGAAAYVKKDHASEELAEAVTRVLGMRMVLTTFDSMSE